MWKLELYCSVVNVMWSCVKTFGLVSSVFTVLMLILLHLSWSLYLCYRAGLVYITDTNMFKLINVISELHKAILPVIDKIEVSSL